MSQSSVQQNPASKGVASNLRSILILSVIGLSVIIAGLYLASRNLATVGTNAQPSVEQHTATPATPAQPAEPAKPKLNFGK